jgi:hypothetical protein
MNKVFFPSKQGHPRSGKNQTNPLEQLGKLFGGK